jgi:curved DNA-binding protein CbpA
MSDRLDELDYYTLLGVADDASVSEIKQAFRAFARRYHPDRFSGDTEEKLGGATRIYRRGAEALSVLTDPELRRTYDAALANGAVRLTTEAREEAERQQRKAAEPAPAAQTPIRTLEAQTLFKRAVEASKREDWATAWKSLRGACAAEPDNDFLQTRFRQLDAKLRAAR